jgi:hypothetical protein
MSELQPPDVDIDAHPIGHVRFWHCELTPQVTSHAHDAPQNTSWHELLPAQLTLHAPVPHVMPWQLPRPVQLIEHDRALVQTTPLEHELFGEHMMSQAQPSGHVTRWLQAPLFAAQLIVHVFCARLHDVQPVGHTAASTSPGPSMPASGNPIATQ